MMSLYERVWEIKKVTGWSQERISAEAGLALSTVSRIFRWPGYVGNETSHKLLKDLYADVVKSPFPPDIEQLFHDYDTWKAQYPKKQFSNFLNTLQPLLEAHKSLDTQELVACRISWLLGNICFDRAFYLKKVNPSHHIKSALSWYQKALAILERYGDKRLLPYKHRLQQCIISTKFHRYQPGKRADSQEIQAWLTQTDYLSTIKAVIREEPWNWIAARHGLVASALLKDFEECQIFWKAMKKINRNFSILSFSPLHGMPAIDQDLDLVWFVEKVGKKRSKRAETA